MGCEERDDFMLCLLSPYKRVRVREAIAEDDEQHWGQGTPESSSTSGTADVELYSDLQSEVGSSASTCDSRRMTPSPVAVCVPKIGSAHSGPPMPEYSDDLRDDEQLIPSSIIHSILQPLETIS